MAIYILFNTKENIGDCPAHIFCFFVFLICWTVLVRIWPWDASQCLQSDQVYRIPTKFRPISRNIRDVRSIFYQTIDPKTVVCEAVSANSNKREIAVTV